ncbi:MAG: type IV secretory system conjugative DNA transfer family protein [Alphaproteobacteria bacterium]|nr:type IV secretory system conjugative DNA transfer family protein [Alphaproteobacteria bacterium]
MSARKRILGLTIPDGRPIFEPTANASSLVLAAMGGGKTTCVAIPTIMSLLADRTQAMFINDTKSGEIAHQIAELARMHGRKFAVIDDFGVMGADYPYRIDVNPFSAAVSVASDNPGELPLAAEGIAHTLISEPGDDAKNLYWRESPRELLGLLLKLLLTRHARLATPGALQSFVADTEFLSRVLADEADDPDSTLKSEAASWLSFRAENPEHFYQHHRAALSSLKSFASGALASAGRQPDMTHAELIRDGWIVCFVSPVQHAERLGAYVALHVLSLLHAQLAGPVGRVCLVLDEFCNSPLKEAVSRITIFRAYGVKAVYITQSRQDIVRKYGEKETAILEENASVKQWLKFSNFEEAERVSKAMGEKLHVSRGLGLNSDQPGFSGNLGIGRERLFSAHELLNLPDDEQIIHIAGLGFIHAKKVRQNQIAPYCFDLGDNPLEGGRLPPDPKVFLSAPDDGDAS